MRARKTKIAYENKIERAQQLEELIKDTLLLVEYIKKHIKDDLKKAVELLE